MTLHHSYLPQVLVVNLLTCGQISIGYQKPYQEKWLKSGKMQIALGNLKNLHSQKVRSHRHNV